MRCRNCGWENPSDKQRCEKCNAPLVGSMIGSPEPPEPQPKRSYQQPEAENLRGTVKETGSEQPYIPEPVVQRPTPPPVREPDTPASPVATSGQCSSCGYPISSWMKACPNCGEPVGAAQPQPKAVLCASCGKPLPAGTKFCPNCGQPVGSTPNPQPAQFVGQPNNPQPEPPVGPDRPPYRQAPHAGTVNPWMKPQAEQGFCSLQPRPWEGEGVTYNPITYSGTEIVLNRANTDPNNHSITSKEQAVLTHEDDGWYIEDRSSLQTTFVRAGHKIRLETGDIIVLGNRLFEFKS